MCFYMRTSIPVEGIVHYLNLPFFWSASQAKLFADNQFNEMKFKEGWNLLDSEVIGSQFGVVNTQHSSSFNTDDGHNLK